MYTPPGVPRSRSLTRLTIRVGLEHFGQSVLLLVSMTFLRSPVLAIFAIMILPWYRYVVFRALEDHRTGFVGPSWTGSSGTSQLDLHASHGGNQRRRTAVNTQLSSLHQVNGRLERQDTPSRRFCAKS